VSTILPLFAVNKNKKVMKKSILITGASSGIGLESTILFAQNNYQVFATYRNNRDEGKLKTIKNVHPVKMMVCMP
jgi:short-subunit dehydrogenase